MKTRISQTGDTGQRFRNLCSKPFQILAVVFILFAGGFSNPAKGQSVHVNINIDIPSWAPYYENRNQVRYYYLPDIECYYDLVHREFVYLNDGVWIFSRFLPPAYAWFNLNNCYVVALDHRVYEPWRHFHYYVSHYPRFYYRSLYKHRHWEQGRPLRGYSENERREVYNHRDDRDYYNRYRAEEQRHREIRRDQERNQKNGYYNQGAGPGRDYKSEPVNYYGKKVGKPVKVQKNMKESGGNREGSKNNGSGRRQH